MWANIREGNTILESYDPEDFEKLLSAKVCRQGLPKFFSLSHEFVNDKRHELSSDNQRIVYQFNTLAQVRKALLEGNLVEVLRSVKTNGDNAQISYSADAKAWVIASKYVALLSRSAKDVQDFYPEDSRYFIARSIALCWFK